MPDKKDTPKIDPKRAERFVWTDDQFTITKPKKTEDTKKDK